MIEVEVVIEGGGWSDPERLEALCARAADAAIAAAPAGPDAPVAVTLLLTDDAAVRVMNRTWRGQDKATNVLSFPSDAPAPPGEARHAGDVALAYETVRREAEHEGKSLDDHTAHLVVHGILHLLGEDHGDDAEALRMEAAEIAALARLGIADPYADRVLCGETA